MYMMELPVMHSYGTWLAQWKQYLTTSPCFVPCMSISSVNTPLVLSGWSSALWGYDNHELAQFFLAGISEDFRIGYNYGKLPLRSAHRNLQGSYDHLEVVDEYLHVEISQGRVVGPFLMDSLPGSHISRFGVIPKGHQTNKWRLIADLSHPHGFSVNDGTPSSFVQ